MFVSKRVVCFIVLLFVAQGLLAQRKYIKELTIGDIVPDISINRLVNFQTSTAKISDFKGKLLILDFWATWCGPCIAAFPKMDSLQKKFSGKIQILPVTEEDKEKAERFLRKMFPDRIIPIPTVANDTVLKTLFKHNYLPHYVWINHAGKVVAITEEKEVNESNIQGILENKLLTLPYKIDNISVTRPRGSRTYIFPAVYLKADATVNLTRIPDSLLEMSSVLTGYIEGAAASGSFDSLSISLRNHSVLGLYSIALLRNTTEALHQNKFQTEIADSALYEVITGEKFNQKQPIAVGLEALSWLRKYAYTYELKVPLKLAGQKYKIMLDDLNRYFGVKYGIEGVVEKRLNKYLALVRTTPIDKIASSKPKGDPKTEMDLYSLKIRNGTVGNFVWSLSLSSQSLPLILDETKYSGPIDLDLNCNLSNLKALNEELKKYDLQLVEREKLMDVAILRMRKL